MKKFLLLLSAASLVALSGCSSDSDSSSSTDGTGNNNVTVTNIDMSKPDTLIGTYKIEYFASSASGTGGASSSWDDLNKYNNVLTENKIPEPSKPLGATFADAHNNYFGKATITYDKDKSNLIINSKLQLKDSSFKNIGIADLSVQQYNFTEYSPIPVKLINAQDNTINKGENTAKGVKGRNLTTEKSWEPAGSSLNAVLGTKNNTYYFKLHTDGKIYHYMKDHSSVLPADVLVVLSKINDKAETLNANKQYTNEEAGKKDIVLNGFKETPDTVAGKQ